jgi:site-specific DNA-methyltransferase (adenine-specific)
MPSSAKDRFTVDFEYIYFFVKNKKYWLEQQFEQAHDWGMRDRKDGKYRKENLHSEKGLTGKYNPQGRNKRCVWKVEIQPYPEAHFATYPEDLIKTPILAGCPKDGVVLDPFIGSGTTGLVALKYDRKFVGIELNEEYIKLANKRIKPELDQMTLF